eukprot:jgi/Chlat1/9194/Chrsp97S08465
MLESHNIALFNGLKRLEYRGYDSAGIAFDAGSVPLTIVANGDDNGSVPYTIAAAVEQARVNLEEVLSWHAGIAHTRWATHGPPSVRNSHPQTSSLANEFVVVHNGIITNYKALKETLVRKGFVFESDTDTEVIPKLIKWLYDQLADNGERVPFPQLVFEVTRQLEGTYGLIFKSSYYPNEIVACKRGSPLILGVKRSLQPYAVLCDVSLCNRYTAAEFYIASDASAVVEHTKQVLVLEDDDILHIEASVAALKGQFAVYRVDRDEDAESHLRVPKMRPESVNRALLTLELEVEQIMKGSYSHFMQKEIHEQPESVLTSMRGRVSTGATSSSKATAALEIAGDNIQKIRRSRRIIFIACGTSYHACLAARQFMEEMSGLPVQMELASDFVDRQCPVFRDDTAVFTSQSGETADTLRALEYAREQGALCVGVTNTVGSAIARGTHCGVHINAGAEIGVASTKAYTSQIVVLIIMALLLGEDSFSKRERRDAIIDDLALLPDKIRKALQLDEQMKSLAEQLLHEQSLLVFGRGYNYSTALEAALKVKEVALMHSEGILAGEMKHGPLALVDETMPIIVIASKDAIFDKHLSVVQQLQARSARLIILCNPQDAETFSEFSSYPPIVVPQVCDCLQPVVNVIPLQLLSYHLTVLRGFNVDQPRNLAKSVTTE